MWSIRHLHVVIFVISYECINYCQCSTSAKTQQNQSLSDAQRVGGGRKLFGVESITPLTNLIADPQNSGYNEAFSTKPVDYHYFNSAFMVTTPKYDAKPVTYYNHLEPEIKHTFYPNTVAHAPSNSYLQLPATPTHIVRVKQEDAIWNQDMMKLENQYLDTFRSIKTSVMGFFYRMQDFVNYVVGFFGDANTSMIESRKLKKKKHKIKKKFKKFMLPLLIAYKLKFFALIPILIGGLVLLVGSTGMAGFFFALFAAVISLKGSHGH